jgi:hypothetical protein
MLPTFGSMVYWSQEDGTIVNHNWGITITPVTLERKSIKGSVQRPGWTVDRSGQVESLCEEFGYDFEIVDEFTSDNPYAIVNYAIMLVFKAMMKEWLDMEREEQLSSEEPSDAEIKAYMQSLRGEHVV